MITYKQRVQLENIIRFYEVTKDHPYDFSCVMVKKVSEDLEYLYCQMFEFSNSDMAPVSPNERKMLSMAENGEELRGLRATLIAMFLATGGKL